MLQQFEISIVQNEYMMYHSIHLPSILDSIHCLDRYVEQIATALQIKKDKQTKMILLLTEAVSNAIKHGNKEDIDKKVTIECLKKHDNERLCFKVSDEGKGFNHEQLRNPTEKHNLEIEGGRGVYLIQKMSQGFYFEKNGACITFICDIN